MSLRRTAVTVAVPGTCGELVQGWSDEWAEPVLVSCPIALYSRVRVELQPGPAIWTANGSSHCDKARQAARLGLDYLGQPDWGARLSLTSPLQPGRGMASSTADIVGVMVGLAQALAQPLTPRELARLACRIEPSDSTMFAGLALFAYRGSGQVCELGPPPALPLLMLDPGYTVDTLTYNARLDLAAVRRLAPSTQAALDLLRHGLRQNAPAAIGQAATLSAASYQAVSHSPLVARAQSWADITGALGLVRAHSGSVVGLLYPLQTDLTEPGRWLAARFDGVITPTKLTGGGYQIIEESQSLLCER